MKTKNNVKKSLFGVQNFDLYGKRQWLRTPGDDEWSMADWDDVNHYEVAMNLRKMCTILNAHWNDPAYADLDPEPYDSSLDDDAAEIESDLRYAKAKDTMRSLES